MKIKGIMIGDGLFDMRNHVAKYPDFLQSINVASTGSVKYFKTVVKRFH